MKYGVKFCGGCNPKYHRKEALTKIENALEEKVEFENVNDEDSYEGLLVIGGCSNCCPNYKHYKTRRKPILLSDKDQVQNIINKIMKEVDEFELERNLQKQEL